MLGIAGLLAVYAAFLFFARALLPPVKMLPFIFMALPGVFWALGEASAKVYGERKGAESLAAGVGMTLAVAMSLVSLAV